MKKYFNFLITRMCFVVILQIKANQHEFLVFQCMFACYYFCSRFDVHLQRLPHEIVSRAQSSEGNCDILCQSCMDTLNPVLEVWLVRGARERFGTTDFTGWLETATSSTKNGRLESVRIGKCQNRRVSELESVRNCSVWKVSELECVRTCLDWKVSELEVSELVEIGKCQNWKVSEIAQIGKCQKQLSLESVRNC